MLISRVARPPEAPSAAADAAAESVAEMAASADTDAESTSEVPAASSPVAESDQDSAQKNRLNSMLTSTRARLQLARGPEWREVVYSQEIDSLLATLAIENDEPPVS
jgi:hypothetical protein